MTTAAEAVLIVTVDLGTGECGPDGGRLAGDVERWLVDAMARHRVPATWAACDPTCAALAGRILACGVGHEPALLAEPPWSGQGAARRSLYRELSVRLRDARAAGINISTLAARGGIPAPYFDILTKHAIQAIFDPGMLSHGMGHSSLELRRCRHGLWELPVSMRLPWKTAFAIDRGINLLLRRALLRAATRRALLHVVISMERLPSAGARARSQLERFLRRACELRDRNKLHIETVASAVRRRYRPCPIVSSQSVLRKAA